MVHSGAVWCVTFDTHNLQDKTLIVALPLPSAGAMRLLLPFGLDVACARREAGSATDNRQVMPDDHSELVPPLPIPNRTVKRLCADDSAATSVKVGHRQAVIRKPPTPIGAGGFCFGAWDLNLAFNA